MNRNKNKIEIGRYVFFGINMKITITDYVKNLELNEEEAIQLELKLNVSKYGKMWKNIGDTLLDFGTFKSDIKYLVVTHGQIDFLLELIAKPDWESCRGMM